MSGPGVGLLIGVITFYVVMVLLFVVGVGLVVAVQASYRGYNVGVWLIAACLGNPVFLLILLGVLPDRKRRDLRERELDDIEGRRRRLPRKLPATAEPMRGSTDVQVRPPQRSRGDEETRLPPDRSLGDEETRG